jgi:hypothetical protein
MPDNETFVKIRNFIDKKMDDVAISISANLKNGEEEKFFYKSGFEDGMAFMADLASYYLHCIKSLNEKEC